MFKQAFQFLVAAFFILSLTTTAGWAKPAKVATLVLYNGYVYTEDADKTVKEAVAVKGDKIVFVGSNAEVKQYIGQGTQVVDLQGKLVLPGFMDGHTHVAGAQQRKLFELSLRNITNPSVEKYLEVIRQFAMDPKYAGMKVLRGAGWDNGVFTEYNKKMFGPEYATLGPSAITLDAVLKGTPLENTPVVFNSSDGHSTWANSKAIELAKLAGDTDTPDPDGGKIERDPKTKMPWGAFRDTARSIIREGIPPIVYTKEQYIQAIKLFEKDMYSYGITGVFGVSGSSGTLPDPAEGNMYNALVELDSKGELGLIYRLSVYANPKLKTEEIIARAVELRDKHQGSDRLQINTVKVFADGVIEGRTGYLLEPYANNEAVGAPADYLGRLIRGNRDEVFALVSALDLNRLQIHVHSIGDGATRLMLDAFERAAKQNGVRDSRHTLTHLQLVSPDDIVRMGKMGVIASVQPYWFCKEDDLFYPVESVYLGTERANREYPMKSFFDNGVIVASASDSPVTVPPYPLQAIERGVSRNKLGVVPAKSDVLGPAEKVSRARMIESFTINVAKEMFCETKVGSLEPGKYANIVVLDKNIIDENKVPDWEIGKVGVSRTIFMGKVVYEAKK